jgi:hypothetical protein
VVGIVSLLAAGRVSNFGRKLGDERPSPPVTNIIIKKAAVFPELTVLKPPILLLPNLHRSP